MSAQGRLCAALAALVLAACQGAPAAAPSQPAPQQPIFAVFVGDSITMIRPPVTRSWPFALSAAMGWAPILNAVGGTGYVEVGGGYAGESFRFRLAKVLAYHPDVVILAGGINDVLRDPDRVHYSTVEATATAMLEALAEVPQVIVLSPFEGTQSWVSPAAVRPVGEALRRAAATHGRPYVDMLGWLTLHNVPRYLQSDGIHLNQAGEDYVAARLLTALRCC